LTLFNILGHPVGKSVGGQPARLFHLILVHMGHRSSRRQTPNLAREANLDVGQPRRSRLGRPYGTNQHPTQNTMCKENVPPCLAVTDTARQHHPVQRISSSAPVLLLLPSCRDHTQASRTPAKPFHSSSLHKIASIIGC
jgi:hypothetical protein